MEPGAVGKEPSKTTRLKKIDISFLQETHCDCNNKSEWCTHWEGQVFLSHGTVLSTGVGVLFSRTFTPTSVTVDLQYSRRVV